MCLEIEMFLKREYKKQKAELRYAADGLPQTKVMLALKRKFIKECNDKIKQCDEKIKFFKKQRKLQGIKTPVIFPKV